MKNVKFAIMAFAALALGLTSCSDNEGPENGKTQTIVVKFPKNIVPQTRMIDEPVADEAEEVALGNTVVFLLTGTRVVAAEDVTADEILDNEKSITDVPASVDGVLVVANIPADDLTNIKTETDIVDIEKYAFSVEFQATEGIGGKVMMGRDVTLTDESSDTKSATIELKSITARFEIGNVVAGTGVEDVELHAVFINNYYATNAATSPTLNPSTYSFWTGYNVNPSADISGADAPIVSSEVTFAETNYSEDSYWDANNNTQVAAGTHVYAYHLFAGEYVPHVILLVSGKYTDSGKYFLGWLTFKSFHDGTGNITGIEGNRIYKVGVTGGISVNANDLTLVPELSAFQLDVTCTVTPWNAVNVTPGV